MSSDCTLWQSIMSNCNQGDQLRQPDYKPIFPVCGTVAITPSCGCVMPGWLTAPTMPCCCKCPIMPWGGMVAESPVGETVPTGITPLGRVTTCDAGTIPAGNTFIIPGCWPGTATNTCKDSEEITSGVEDSMEINWKENVVLESPETSTVIKDNKMQHWLQEQMLIYSCYSMPSVCQYLTLFSHLTFAFPSILLLTFLWPNYNFHNHPVKSGGSVTWCIHIIGGEWTKTLRHDIGCLGL